MVRALSRQVSAWFAAFDGPCWLLLIILVGGPLAIGGVPVVARLALAAFATMALLLVVLRLHVGVRRLRMGAVAFGLGVLVLWTLFQWLPLVPGVADWLAPGATEAAALAADTLGLEQTWWRTTSLDRGRTAAALLSLWSMLAVYLTVLNLTFRRRLLVKRMLVLAAIGGLCVGVLQTALNMDEILGVYQAKAGLQATHLKATFVNPNHTAVFLLLGVFVSFDAWLDSRDRALVSRLYLLIIAALTLGVLATLSRANIVLVICGLTLLALYLWFRERGGSDPAASLRVVLTLCCVGTVAVLLFGGRPWVEEIGSILTGDIDHVLGPARAAWEVGLSVAGDHLWVGAGHGAFSVAAATAMEHWDFGFASYAHNGLIQAVADWGLPATVLALGFILFGLSRAFGRSLRHGLSPALTFGLGAVLIQNMVDFSIWIPGIGHAVMALMACLIADLSRASESGNARESASPRTRTLTVGFFAVTLVALVGADAVQHDPVAAESRLLTAFAQDSLPDDNWFDELVMAHPSDHRLVALAAVARSKRGHQHVAQGLAARARDLAPREPGTLEMVSRVYLESSKVAAAAETLIDLAKLGPAHRRTAHHMVWRHRDLDDLVARYHAHDADLTLSSARLLMSSRQFDSARSLLSWASEQFPDSVDLKESLGAVLGRDPKDAKQLSALVTDMLGRGGRAQDPVLARQFRRAAFMLEGYRLKSQGELQTAYHAFVEAAELDSERALGPWLEAGTMLALLKDMERLALLLPQITGAQVGARPDQKVAYALLASQVEEHQGDLDAARGYVQAALRQSPRAPRLLGRLAALLDALGERDHAQRVRARIALLKLTREPSLSDWMNPEAALRRRGEQ